MNLLFTIVVVVVILILLAGTITIIPQNYQGLVETFGKYTRSVAAGLNFKIPLVQRVQKVSLALQPLALQRYSVITKDNADVQVSVTLNYQVADAQKYFYNNTNSEESMSQLVRGHLRDIIGRMSLDQALGQTAQINKELFDAVDGLTGVFGIKIIRVNIDELDPSKEIQEAMDQQLTADRKKRAQIAQAEGEAKNIELTNNAQNQALINTAKAQATAKKTAADAEAYRTQKVQAALADADNNYFKNQSLQTFAHLADGNDNLVVMDRNEIDQLGDVPVAKKLLGLDDPASAVSKKPTDN